MELGGYRAKEIGVRYLGESGESGELEREGAIDYWLCYSILF